VARLTQRRNRRRGKGTFRLHKPQWIDPFPWIAGTEPEKRFFEALVLKRIYFIFQGQIPEFEEGIFVSLAIADYKPDFVLPEFKVVIDPYSPYHHTLKDAEERDIYKMALYEAMGYRYYFPWALGEGVFSLDQENAVNLRGSAMEVLQVMPELAQTPQPLAPIDAQAKARDGYRIGQNLGAGATSVAAANRKRRKPPALALKTRRRSRR
jgi:hypothetical protein